jgi:octaprenyl-diphosphate synthase
MTKSAVTRALNDLYRSIQPELERVEVIIRDMSRHDNPLISEINEYLFTVAGKRPRPALLLLCGRLHGRPSGDAPFWSALVEVIHTASLVHDDIVDNSGRRRGRDTVHAKWGPNITVLLGDFLYIKAIVLALKKGQPLLIDILADVTSEMIEGELIESSWSGNPDIPESVYLDVLNKKTASLFAGACRIGAVLGGADPDAEARLERFGRSLGLCFQIIDDWLDYTGDAAALGKPVLSDVREGRTTLPLILSLAGADSRGRAEIAALIKNSGTDGSGAARILDIVRRHGALDETWRRARKYAAEAKSGLAGIADSEAKAALVRLTDLLLERNT